MMDEIESTTELIADINFIVMEDKHLVFDLTTGMLYRLVNSDDPERYASVRIIGVTSAWGEMFTNETALDFWKQLMARVDMSY